METVEISNEFYRVCSDRYGSKDTGRCFILHIGDGKFDIYDKDTGDWYKGSLRFPYSLFQRYRTKPKVRYLKLDGIYEDHRDLVFCRYCERKFIVPARFDKCNECYRETVDYDFKIKYIYGKESARFSDSIEDIV